MAVSLAAPLPTDRLLDLATGTGAVLREVASRPGAPIGAVGIDQAGAMLAAAAASLPPGWRLLRAEAAALPFGDESFDLVISAYLLHLLDIEMRGRVLAEVRRVLGPRGRFVTVTPAVPLSPLVRALLGLFVRSSALGGALRPLDPRAELEEAGFRIVEARPVRRGYPSLVVAARMH